MPRKLEEESSIFDSGIVWLLIGGAAMLTILIIVGVWRYCKAKNMSQLEGEEIKVDEDDVGLTKNSPPPLPGHNDSLTESILGNDEI